MIKGNYTEHQNLIKRFVKLTSLEMPNIINLPYDVGTYRAYSDPDRIVKLGQEGVLDRLIILKGGQVMFLDAKTGKAKLAGNQKDFKQRFLEVAGYDGCLPFGHEDEGLEILMRMQKVLIDRRK